MVYKIRYSEEKNQLLKATRKICFEDVIKAIETKNLIANIAHPSKKHPNQWMYVVRISDYAYAVPYVQNGEKKEIFLKTVYPSRVLTRKYLKG